MSLRKQIEEYVPFGLQEEADKTFILHFMDTFSDVLTRKNTNGHFTSSAFILNKQHDKLLMVHHNIYNSWAWVGGHADGEEDLLAVALREATEETGITQIKPITNNIFVLDVLPVAGHMKKGAYVSSHVHLSVCYLLEANEQEIVRVQEEENSDVKWIPLEEVVNHSTEPHMKIVYQKALDKLKKI